MRVEAGKESRSWTLQGVAGNCCGLNVSPHSYVKTLRLSMMPLRSKAFGRYLGHEGGALTNGVSAVIKNALVHFDHVRTQNVYSLKPERTFLAKLKTVLEL